MSVLLQLGACHDGIDLEAVTASTDAPNPRPRIAPPSPTLSPQKLPPTQRSRPLNPDAPPVQLQAVSMEQYTACVHLMRVPLLTCLMSIFYLCRLMQQQWMQWGVYAQQYASLYSFQAQPMSSTGYVVWGSGAPTAASDAQAQTLHSSYPAPR